MRRVFLLLLLLAVLVAALLSGCRDTPAELFAYQKHAAKIEGTLSSGDDVFGVTITLDPWEGEAALPCRSGRIVFTSPEALSSLILEFSAASVYVVSGDVRIPLAVGSLSTVNLLSCLFCLDEETVEGISSEAYGGGTCTVVRVKNDRLRAAVWLDRASGLPEKIEATGDGMSFLLTLATMEILE